MRFLSIAAAFCLSWNAIADININNENVSETYTSTVKVSGNFHLGIQYEGNPNLDELYVNIPEDSNGLLCVKLASIDGQYKAELRHDLTDYDNGFAKVNFSSKYKNELTDLKENELAVLALIGEDCQSSKSKILIASWSKNIEGLSPVLLIRSDARKDEVHAPSIGESKFNVKCEMFENTNKVTFDKYCYLEGLDFSKYSTLEVERKHFRKMKNEKIILSL